MGWDGTKDTLFCFDAVTGRLNWSQSYPCGPILQWPGPRATPTVHGDTVFAFDLLTADAHHAGAAHDEIDLLLARVGMVVLATGYAGRDREVVEAERLSAQCAPDLLDRAPRPLTFQSIDIDEAISHCLSYTLARRRLGYILKTPNLVCGMGAFSAADSPSASTRRVSRGSMTPSSQSRAVE